MNDLRNENLQVLSFDLVMSNDVLEDMFDPYSADREIFRILKPAMIAGEYV